MLLTNHQTEPELPKSLSYFGTLSGIALNGEPSAVYWRCSQRQSFVTDPYTYHIDRSLCTPNINCQPKIRVISTQFYFELMKSSYICHASIPTYGLCSTQHYCLKNKFVCIVVLVVYSTWLYVWLYTMYNHILYRTSMVYSWLRVLQDILLREFFIIYL